MSNASLTIRVTPRRMLSATEAAGYVGVPVKHFARECRVQPVEIAGRKLFDMRDLDGWIDSLKSGSMSSDDDIIARL